MFRLLFNFHEVVQTKIIDETFENEEKLQSLRKVLKFFKLFHQTL